MELREAYETLKVEPGLEPKQARRAYLKLLKVHKPETDPEGFKAIREAWERIKDAPEWEVRALRDAPLPADTPTDAGDVARDMGGDMHGGSPFGAGSPVSWSKPKRSWAEQAQLSREGKLFDDPPDPAPAMPPIEPPLDPDAPPTMAMFYARCSGATDAARVAIGREAVAKLPDDPEAHWLLHESLLVTSQMAEAASALRAAHQRGLDGFFEPLVRQHPEHLSTAEIELAVQRSGETLDALMVADAMLRCARPQAAADAMRRGIESARRGGEPPSARGAVDLVLRLYREQQPEVAASLFQQVGAWMRESGVESEIAGSYAAASYALLCELAALPAKFPGEVSASIARAILDGDVSFALRDVAQWVLAQPKRLKEIEADLMLHAPTLHRSLAPVLLPPDQVNRPPALGPMPVKSWGGGGGGGWGGGVQHPETGRTSHAKWIALAVGLFLFVAVQIALRQSRPRPVPSFPNYEQSYGLQHERIQELLRNTQGLLPPSEAQVEVAAIQLCAEPDTELCRYANGLSEALRARDCVVARDHFQGLQHAVGQAPGQPDPITVSEANGTFRRALDDRCPPADP